MQKKWKKIQSIIISLVAIYIISAHAAPQPPIQPQEYPPFLSSYWPPAPTPGPPIQLKSKYAWLTHFYLAGRFIYSFTSIKNIKFEDSQEGDPAIAQSSQNKGAVAGAVAVGYIFKKSGLLSRVEIEYTNRASTKYDANPVFNFTVIDPPIISLDSKIKNQTVLAKFYYDIDTHTIASPYVQGGVGISHNCVDSNSSNALPLPPPFNKPLLSSSQFTKTNFAWDVGAGLRFLFSKHVSMNVGYQFTWLGDLGWRIETFDPNDPFILRSKDFYSNDVVVGLMVHG